MLSCSYCRAVVTYDIQLNAIKQCKFYLWVEWLENELLLSLHCAVWLIRGSEGENKNISKYTVKYTVKHIVT